MGTGSPLTNLAKGITDAAFVLDRDRNIQEFNRIFPKLHTIESRDLKHVVGRFCQDFVHMEICENNCILKKCLESGTPVRFDEVKGSTSSGEELNLIVTAIPMRNEKGEIDSVIEIHRDVTDEARIHAKYKVMLDREKRAKEELEHLVDVRTQELRQANDDLKRAEAQMVHSEKMSALGQMVAGIAHELNNPINFISGNVDSMEDYAKEIVEAMGAIQTLAAKQPAFQGPLAKILKDHDIEYVLEDFSKIIRSVRNGGERAAEIVQGLKTFSRLDQAQLKDTDLHEDMDMTLTLLQHELKGHANIHKEYGNLPPVQCHSSQINQVFMNLLHNAIQALPAEGDIWIRTRAEGANVIVEIEDNGSGIAPENIKKIFDPFFTTKEIGKGTGLGLSISYGIIERHGGKIDVKSTVGKGTTFQVTLPIRAVELTKV